MCDASCCWASIAVAAPELNIHLSIGIVLKPKTSFSIFLQLEDNSYQLRNFRGLKKQLIIAPILHSEEFSLLRL